MPNQDRNVISYAGSLNTLKLASVDGYAMPVRVDFYGVDSLCRIETLDEAAGSGVLINDSVHMQFDFEQLPGGVRIYTRHRMAETPPLDDGIILSGARFVTLWIESIRRAIRYGLYIELKASNRYTMYLAPVAIVGDIIVFSLMCGNEQVRDYRARILSTSPTDTAVVFMNN